MAIRYLSGINVDSNTLFVDSTNNRVGIGTGSPGFKLTVVGGNGNQLGLDNAGERFTQISFLESGSQNSAIWLDGTDNMFDIYANTSHGIRLKTGGDNTRLTVASGGNVLIGTTTDSGYKLYVVGTGTSTNLGVVGNIRAGGTGVSGGEIIASGALGNGNYVSLRHDDTNGYITVTRAVYDGHLILQPYGNVGIGTTSPSALLNVAGSVTIGSASVATVNLYLTRTNGGVVADANYFVSGNNTPNQTWIEGGYYTGELAGVVTAPNSGYPYFEAYSGQGSATAKSFGFVNKTSGSFISTDFLYTMALLRTGQIRFNQYGSGSFTGTATYGLAVDSSGNIIEVTSAIDGSGTANYVTKWQDANTLTNSVIYDNGTNVSIGTTANPGSRTNIYLSEAGATPNAILRLQNTGSQYLAKMIITDGNTNDAVIGYQGGVTSATQYLGFGLGTAITQMVLTAAGNVGIGTTSPQLVGAAWTTLEVQGQSSGGGGIVYTANNGATVKSHFYTDGTSGFVGTQTNHYFGFTTNNQERARFTAGGNLLIGTTTDAAHLLYVNGSARFNGVAYAASRLMVGITSDQSYASIFVGGDITTGSSQYALLLDPQLSGTSNYGLLANARIKASTAATNAYGVYILNNELLSGASVVNNYGLYIANQTSGSSVNYALYSAGGTSYFAGNVGIGNGSPNSKLVVARDVTDNDLSQFGYVQLKLIGSTASSKQLLLGFETENNYGFIQTLQDGASWTAYNLALQWKGGNVGIGTKSPVVRTHIVGPTLTTTSETTYPLWLSDTGDTTKALILGFDLANDVGVIQAVDQAVAWKSVSLAPIGGNVLIGTTTDGGYKLRVNGTGRYDDYLQFWSGTAGASPRLIFGGETSSTDKSIFLESFYMVFQGHNNEGFKFQTTSSLGAVSNRMSILGTGTIVFSNYGSGSKTGTAAYNLSVDASGNIIETANSVDGSGTANYVTKWQDANTVTNSQMFDNGTNVGINNATPKTKLDINGTIGFGSKSMSMTDSFADALTVNMNAHNGCYVKITAFGDWSAHSTIAYLGEFFLQNGDGAYGEPGTIIRQVDNTPTDDIQAQIVDPAGSGIRDFIIQLKTTSASGTPFTAYLQYEVRGQYNSVS